jgi:hypothetical protein
MQLAYAITLLVSATLLFLVQPMFAKLALPLLGGTPNVWNTCMVFYQAALLAGYLYAHLSTRLLGTRRQAALHLALLCVPWVVLPIGIHSGWVPPAEANPVPWLLMLLTASVGLPFVVVAASAPMLQAWFADTRHPAANDPYFLYAASNLGSMISLVAYPTLVEPNLTLAGQTLVWTAGFGLLMLLTLGCAVLLWRSFAKVPQYRKEAEGEGATDEERGARGPELGTTDEGQGPMDQEQGARDAAAPPLPLGEGRGEGTCRVERLAPPGPQSITASPFLLRLRWLVLSLVPSSLLLGVTTHISTDIAAVPLLWVIPLALYLLTFVLVFARRTILPHRWMVRLQPFLVVPVAGWFYLSGSHTSWLFVPLHLAMFFVTAMVCHGELATIISGYSSTLVNRLGATRALNIPPSTPPTDIHR